MRCGRKLTLSIFFRGQWDCEFIAAAFAGETGEVVRGADEQPSMHQVTYQHAFGM